MSTGAPAPEIPEWISIARSEQLETDRPFSAVAEGVELVVVRRSERTYVLSGRCPHRAARLGACATVEEDRLVCGRHGWDFRLADGTLNAGDEGLARFPALLDGQGTVWVEAAAVRAFARAERQVFRNGEEVD
jgi:nitrite reductase/ring-hydroxylating ferredoxin subunit